MATKPSTKCEHRFVAMNPNNGAVLSMVGGFNFVHNKFNRATQSIRQVGSWYQTIYLLSGD
ncbi:hypothetical protein O9992_07575 [Vibrio lentus]|nr:hypothetical protein [Vibrio lentus]